MHYMYPNQDHKIIVYTQALKTLPHAVSATCSNSPIQTLVEMNTNKHILASVCIAVCANKLHIIRVQKLVL